MLRFLEDDEKKKDDFDPTDNFGGKMAKPFPDDKDGDGRVNESVVVVPGIVRAVTAFIDNDMTSADPEELGISIAKSLIVGIDKSKSMGGQAGVILAAIHKLL